MEVKIRIFLKVIIIQKHKNPVAYHEQQYERESLTIQGGFLVRTDHNPKQRSLSISQAFLKEISDNDSSFKDKSTHLIFLISR